MVNERVCVRSLTLNFENYTFRSNNLEKNCI